MYMTILFNYFLALLIILSPFYLYSQSDEDTTDTTFSFEDLLSIEISGDVKYNEVIKQSGNSITIITADDIKKKGFLSFNDILNYVSDFTISSDRMWTFIGTRGITFPSSYGTRLAISIDGNPLLDYTFASILNSSVLEISLEFIERVELISGPPSLRYGPNGMLGAINIVTKEGKDLDGGVVKASVTHTGETNLDFTLGNKWSNGLDIMFSYRGIYNPGSKIYFEKYDDNKIYGDTNSDYYNPRASNGGIADKKDNSLSNIFYLNAKYNGLTLNVLQTMSNRRYPSAGYGTIFNDDKSDIDMIFTNVVLFYDYKTSIFDLNHTITPKVYYSRSISNIYYNYDDEDEEGNPYILSQKENAIYSGFDIEIKDLVEITNSSNLVLSIGYTGSIDYDYRFSEGINHTFATEERDVLSPLKLFSGYLEYNHELTDWFSFFGGARYETTDQSNSVFLPRLGVIFDIGYNSIIKGLFGTAGRKPSGNDEYLSNWLEIDEIDPETNDTTFKYKSGNLKYEKVTTFELIYLYRNTNFLGNISFFYNDIRDLVLEGEVDDKRTSDPSYPFLCVNIPADMAIRNYGISFSAKYKINRLEFLLGNTYSFVDVDMPDPSIFSRISQYDRLKNASEIGSYRNSLVYGVSFEIIDFVYINLFGKYESSRKAVDRGDGVDDENIVGVKDLPVAHNLDITLVYRPVAKEGAGFLDKLYFVLNFKNILDRIDYYPISPTFGTVSKVPRNNGFSFGITLGYKF